VQRAGPGGQAGGQPVHRIGAVDGGMRDGPRSPGQAAILAPTGLSRSSSAAQSSRSRAVNGLPKARQASACDRKASATGAGRARVTE
jgi:hypothetical protein